MTPHIALRAAVLRFRREVCNRKKLKIPNQNLGLDELFLVKDTLSPIGFLFYANGGKIGFAALMFASRGPEIHYLNVAWK